MNCLAAGEQHSWRSRSLQGKCHGAAMTCQCICGLCTALTGRARKSGSNTVSQHAAVIPQPQPVFENDKISWRLPQGGERHKRMRSQPVRARDREAGVRLAAPPSPPAIDPASETQKLPPQGFRILAPRILPTGCGLAAQWRLSIQSPASPNAPDRVLTSAMPGVSGAGAPGSVSFVRYRRPCRRPRCSSGGGRGCGGPCRTASWCAGRRGGRRSGRLAGRRQRRAWS